jgi:hypothetical protein
MNYWGDLATKLRKLSFNKFSAKKDAKEQGKGLWWK